MPPTSGGTGARNADLTAQLVNWSKANGTGVPFDSSTGFKLPNGATRSPDASWLRKERWNRLTEEEKEEKFAPSVPSSWSSSDPDRRRVRRNFKRKCAGSWLKEPSSVG